MMPVNFKQEAGKYLRLEKGEETSENLAKRYTPLQMAVSINISGVKGGFTTTVASVVRGEYAPNHVKEALERITTPNPTITSKQLNQDDLLIFRLRPKKSTKKQKLLPATIFKMLFDATRKASRRIR